MFTHSPQTSTTQGSLNHNAVCSFYRCSGEIFTRKGQQQFITIVILYRRGVKQTLICALPLFTDPAFVID